MSNLLPVLHVCVACDRSSPSETRSVLYWMGFGCEVFTLKKLECSKQARSRLNTLAWNNGIGLCVYFVGLKAESND